MTDAVDGKPVLRAEERHRAILESVEKRGTVKISELAHQLGVSAVTLRVDVRELARNGLVARVHGGATRIAVPAGADGRPAGSPSTALYAPATRAPGAPTIGMVVPHSAYYYPKVVAGARSAADALGAKLVLGVSQNDVAEERSLVTRLLEAGIDGLVIATRLDPSRSRETEEWLRSIPVPTVLAERRVGRDSGSVEQVATDHEFGAYTAVRHLAGLGHHRIGLLHSDTITAPRLRAGYEEARSELGLEECASEVPRTLDGDSPAAVDQAAAALIECVRAGTADALLVHNDAAALPLVSRLRQAGIEIPGDLAVVTYDDELAALADPPLTAVGPPREAVGAAAVDLLMQRLREPRRPPHQLLLRPELRVRASCGALAAGASPIPVAL
ncbi:DNA-binding LacI/PurR family transcriptional regulator [Kribbella aluminosa]|uniref:DNA-binding LacI/PurR family transcriptional regulator n=1 Tax=Kribbella aluminosa TaxID=416017 RepID=A0ABS4UWX4_9ACTN|nr:substrate-binding domain-containing protein [Kribbella aluminosa]MBP2356149.1 DNA-binding LacI/PurR family transcriptional regulator [Kribbella aluminosa]